MNNGNFSSRKGVSGAPVTSADATGGVMITDAIPSGQFCVLDDFVLSTKVAMDVTFKEEATGNVVQGPFYMPATGSLQITLSGKDKATTKGKRLQMFSTATGAVTVAPMWHVEE